MNLDTLRRALGPAAPPSDELAALAATIGQHPPTAVRVRPGLSVEQLPFSSEQVRWHDRAAVVPSGVRPGGFVQYAAGDYYIQDAGSALATHLLHVVDGECVCDMCAAPGGKSTAILESLPTSGWLLANESIAKRHPALQLNLARHGSVRFVLSRLDPERLALALGPVFDAVLVDAPCSGQSLLGRRRQTPTAFQQHTIDYCARRQTRILAAAAQLVRPGGRIVYSTCTFSYAENEGIAAMFLDSHPNWDVDPEPTLAEYESPVRRGSYRLWPHRDPTAGAFAVRLRRDVTATVDRATANRPGRLASSLLATAAPTELTDWGTLADTSTWQTGHRLIGWPQQPLPPLLSVATAGPELAVHPHQDWRPAYALAMRADAGWKPRATLELDDAAACAYLQGSPLPCAQHGWLVATWHGRSLGWLKSDGTRAKNHLPKAARLTGTIRVTAAE